MLSNFRSDNIAYNITCNWREVTNTPSPPPAWDFQDFTMCALDESCLSGAVVDRATLIPLLDTVRACQLMTSEKDGSGVCTRSNAGMGRAQLTLAHFLWCFHDLRYDVSAPSGWLSLGRRHVRPPPQVPALHEGLRVHHWEVWFVMLLSPEQCDMAFRQISAWRYHLGTSCWFIPPASCPLLLACFMDGTVICRSPGFSKPQTHTDSKCLPILSASLTSMLVLWMYTCPQLHTNAYDAHVHACVYTHWYAYIRACEYTYIWTDTCMCVCTYACLYKHVCVRIHSHPCTYVQTHMQHCMGVSIHQRVELCNCKCPLFQLPLPAT